jgi:pyruvate dehydrogenase E1 component alpha subunit
MGGTMHVADFSKGIMGANGIVGGGISLIAGAALAASLDKSGAVGVAFFGDGAAAQGVVSEALNLTALWKLPMVMVCENNEWSEFSPAHTVTAGRISERAAPYGVASVEVDGNDVEAVWVAAREAVERARSGLGPTFIEAMTYRLCGHVEAESGFLAGAKYRPDEEVTRRRERDPLDLYRNALLQTGVLSERTWSDMQSRVAEIVLEAVSAAEAAPHPPLGQVQEFMFHNQMP